MGLPLHIDRLTFSNNISESIAHQLYAVVTRNPEHAGFDAEILDASGTRYLHLTGYQTIQLPDAIDAQKLKALQAAMASDLIAA
jgi:hypothetical protein